VGATVINRVAVHASAPRMRFESVMNRVFIGTGYRMRSGWWCRWRNGLGLGLGYLCGGLMGCQERVSQEQITQWRQAAIAENDRLTQRQASDLTKNWTLTLQGQVPKSTTYTWPQLEQRSTYTLSTRKFFADSPKTPFTFRGVLLKSLLEEAGVNFEVEEKRGTEVTVVAADAYHTVMTFKDIRERQGLLAIVEDGKPIRRNDGGPLQLVTFNDPRPGQPLGGWCYYTTHIIIGTEPIRLAIGPKVLTQAALERLPQHTVTTLVGYKHYWSSEPAQLTGVKITDLLRSQGLSLPKTGGVRVRRKSMLQNDPQKSTLLPAELLNRCDVMVAHRWGPTKQPIPAKKGGPLTLAYGPNCTDKAGQDLAWLPFVESIHLEAGSVGKTSDGAKP
jgi:DMSO/TMAO reductase YedYZ molybdopterin-dependent catalytic subunit